jgi:hypothetical protein
MPLRHVLYVLQIVQINANIRPEQCISPTHQNQVFFGWGLPL